MSSQPLIGDRACPCGTGRALSACCGPLLDGSRLAATPEELMRSRFTAYALGDAGYVFRTWHPRTRPDDVSPDPGTTWTRLEILDASGDEVEFVAHHESPAGAGRMHERSRFEQRAGRWLYLTGDVD